MSTRDGTVTITLELHGRLADGAPSKAWEITLDDDSCRVDDALRSACRTLPGLADGLAGVAFAIGDRVVDRGARLASGDVLALLPPVSGG